MSEIRLKPCPMCGNKAIIKEYKGIFNGEDYNCIYITCDDITCGIYTDDFVNDEEGKEALIKYWNTRYDERVANIIY